MGDSADPQDKQKFVQRSLLVQAAQPKDTTSDPISPEAILAMQRNALKMKDGLNGAFGISPRGTDMPDIPKPAPLPGQPGSTKDAPKEPAAPDDLIPAPTDPEAPYQNPQDQSQQQANDRYENNKRYRDRTGKGNDDAPLIGYP